MSRTYVPNAQKHVTNLKLKVSFFDRNFNEERLNFRGRILRPFV